MISAGHDSTTSALGISILRIAESDERPGAPPPGARV